MSRSGQSRQIWEKDWSQQVEHMQVQNGTEPSVRKQKYLHSEISLLANSQGPNVTNLGVVSIGPIS